MEDEGADKPALPGFRRYALDRSRMRCRPVPILDAFADLGLVVPARGQRKDTGNLPSLLW